MVTLEHEVREDRCIIKVCSDGRPYARLYKIHNEKQWYLSTSVSLPQIMGKNKSVNLTVEFEFTKDIPTIVSKISKLRKEEAENCRKIIKDYYSKRWLSFREKKDVPQDIFNMNDYCTMINVGDFSISNYTVTEKLWNDVMELEKTESMLPKTEVSYYAVQYFLEKLNKITGKNYHLPTEAEWEYAARGGKLSEGYEYAGSNDIDEVAWYSRNSDGNVHAVGGKAPNELGIYDMNGSVWEWCGDRYDSDRVARGGSWRDDASDCRVAHRISLSPELRNNDLGFRVAL
jgi:hypothetical protein